MMKGSLLLVLSIFCFAVFTTSALANDAKTPQSRQLITQMSDRYAKALGSYYINRRCQHVTGPEWFAFTDRIVLATAGVQSMGMPMKEVVQAAYKSTLEPQYKTCGTQTREIVDLGMALSLKLKEFFTVFNLQQINQELLE